MAADDVRPDPLNRPQPTVRDLLRQDPREQPWQLKEAPYADLGLGGIAPSSYLSSTFAALEMQGLWGRTWQMACREEQIPEVGDHVLYEIGPWSLIIVRSAENEIRAHYNACLHRGRQLRDCGGKVAAFRCPFHGFTWSLDGSLQHVPTPWDFPQIQAETFKLPQARVGLWGGFVFVCMYAEAPPLETFLEDIPAIYARWPMEDRFLAAYVSKPINCNWKLALEAFIESFHVSDTHPQAASYIGDFNTQYDVWEDKKHYSRMISPRGLASPSLGGALSDDEILQASEPDAGPITVPEGSTPRAVMADRRRAQLAPVLGPALERLTDSEAVDTIQYLVFPNLVLWFGHNAPICYRFRPLGTDPDWCTQEVFLLVPVPHGKARPKAAKLNALRPDQPWTDAKELGGLGAVFEQDAANLWAIQKGLRSLQRRQTTLGRYQENRLRHFHKTLADYVSPDDPPSD
ncbi:MAG: aromatic ring-hydroxylating oxygenase subunit alpha [Caulobacterales bacterium]